MYYQPKDSIDVVMLGSSHIHCDINTAKLWRDYGISAYDYSAAEQPLWMTYHYLVEICKTQKPKVAVLDLYGPAHFTDEYQYEWIQDNILGMRFSLNKLRMIFASAEPKRIPDYFPAFSYYHNRFDRLDEEDFNEILKSSKEKAAFKGYTPYFEKTVQTESEFETNEIGELTPKSEIYLLKIMDFCKRNDIELFFIVIPYVTEYGDELVYNRIREIANGDGTEFICSMDDYALMGLDFSTDFNDPSHLNYDGSCKFTDFLATKLLERCELEDHRGDPYYESWDRHVEEIDSMVREYGNK